MKRFDNLLNFLSELKKLSAEIHLTSAEIEGIVLHAGPIEPPLEIPPNVRYSVYLFEKVVIL